MTKKTDDESLTPFQARVLRVAKAMAEADVAQIIEGPAFPWEQRGKAVRERFWMLAEIAISTDDAARA